MAGVDADRQVVCARIQTFASVNALNDAGRGYVRDAVLLGASRPVGRTSLFSNTGARPDANGLTTEWESESAERVYILLNELLDDVSLFSQPPPLQVSRHDSRGRSISRPHTPDFLRISESSIRLIQVKKLLDLHDLGRKYPDDWNSCGETWTYGPLASASKALGIGDEIFYPEIFSPNYRANLDHLAAIKRRPASPLSQRLVEQIQDFLSDRPRSLAKLLVAYTSINGDHLITLVTRGVLFAHLDIQVINSDLILYASNNQAQAARSYCQC